MSVNLFCQARAYINMRKYIYVTLSLNPPREEDLLSDLGLSVFLGVFTDKATNLMSLSVKSIHFTDKKNYFADSSTG